MHINEMLKSLNDNEQSIPVIAGYLGYSVGKNPNDPESEWGMLFSSKIPNKNHAILALKAEPNLDIKTTTMDVRKLYKQVEQLGVSFGGSFDAEIAGFVGNKRIILFRVKNGNRDERLDLNIATIDKSLYQDNFNMIKNTSISVTVDDFWGDYVIDGLKDVFKRELTNHFLQMVALYRKKLSEFITAKSYKEELVSLVSDNAKAFIKMNSLTQLVEDESYTSVLSNVVDTMILRQLMRRFLEAYYGKDNVDPFELSGIALGVGKGTLDSAIEEAVEVYGQLADETSIIKLNKRKNVIPEVVDYEEISLFDDEEYAATSKIGMRENSKQKLVELHKKATEQFQTVYGGDLFASSIGDVTTKIENLIVENDPELWAKFWVDTSSERYSFRFEDIPPEALEKQYENSMSQNVQIKIEDGKPVIYYGEDLQEQKNKGAYYTDEKFVQYMVRQTVEIEFQNRIVEVKEAINNNDDKKLLKKLDHLFNMKIADLTAGGGSFLRGAFRQLAEKHDALVGLKVSDSIRNKYPMLKEGDEGILVWEEYILHNMIYGVDIDYKAILISSLSLMLSSLQHRPVGHELPKLISKTLIHQNSLMNAVPFYERENIYSKYKSDIKKLIKLKNDNSSKFYDLNKKLQIKLLKHAQRTLDGETQFLHVEAIEINLPEIFFNSDGTIKEKAGFDCIIGNPPWETWKPNSDEFFSRYDLTYRSSNKIKKMEIQQNLFTHFPELKLKWEKLEKRIGLGSSFFRCQSNYRFQSWSVEKRKTGSDLNLYKLALERFTQLANNNAMVSVLVPDNLMTDLGSTGLRHMIFDNHTILEFLSFENRNNIFPAVDTRQKFAVLTYEMDNREIDSFFAFFYKRNLEDLQKSSIKIDYPIELVVDAEPEKYSLFTPRNQVEFRLYKKVKLRYTPLLNTKLFEVSNDFHRTNDSKYFKAYKKGDIPLYEGKLMGQFILVDSPKEGVIKADALSKIGNDLFEFRIGYRDISSSTNRRTIIATLFPPLSVAAHSLYMQKNADQNTIQEKLFYLAMLNSYVLDFIMRKLIDKHVSQTFLKQLPIPTIEEFVYIDDILQISKELLLLEGDDYLILNEQVGGNAFRGFDYKQLVAELNARVAIGFDLTRQDLIDLLKTFESVNHKEAVQEEAQRIIEVFDRLIEGE